MKKQKGQAKNSAAKETLSAVAPNFCFRAQSAKALSHARWFYPDFFRVRNINSLESV
ncbi:MAG TPA: hypothetical protein VGY98_11025 [Verrucomicrobiae bacterium]|nr:hypothetical protein [Verrucomicrobiae bacterium]